MSGIINRLSNLLANQIAAGEVVQSPASAIKELVENSIDAGASYVIVSIKEGGKKSIQVIDDGKGMSSDDALMAFERHATSKISTVEDLFAINTFGFRGEALASIASVAEVELQTRREEDEIGIMVSINGGTFVSSEPVAYPSCGSQFVVKNLFYNIPARKKSLKTDFAETKKVIKEFEKIALCYPKVAFSLYADDKLLYMLPSTNNIRQRILSLSGKSIGKALVELYVNTSMVEVKGYIGKPEIAKKRPDTFLFVNGRYFDSPYFFKAVQNGYDKLIPDGSYVPFFLYLNVDSQSIDVNISPTKTAVKFDEEQAIWQIINAAVRESLGKNGIIPMIDFDSNTNDADMAASPVYLSTVSKEFTAYSEKLQSSPTTTYNPFNDSFSFSKAVSGKTDSFRDLSQDDKVVLTDELVDSFDTSGDIGLELDSESFTSMSEVSLPQTDSDSISIEYEEYVEPKQEELFVKDFHINNIFTFSDGLAVADIDANLYIFHINRVVKNVNYYRFLERLSSVENKHPQCQKLLFPSEITFSVEDKLVLENSESELSQLGFRFETVADHPNLLSFTHVPVDIEPSDTEWFLEELLTTIKYSDAQAYQRTINENLAMSLSSTISRRKKSYYDEKELRYIITELIESGHYSYTIDSKPIMVSISSAQIIEMLSK